MFEPGSTRGTTPFDLTASFTSIDQDIPEAPLTVYTGYLKCGSFADNEMFTIVVPFGITQGLPFALYFKWTNIPDPSWTANVAITDAFKGVNLLDTASGKLQTKYCDATHNCMFTLTFVGKTGTLDLKLPPQDNGEDGESGVGSFEVAHVG